MRKILALFAALCLLAAVVPLSLAVAQDGTVIPRSSFLHDLWTIVQPLVVLLFSIVGPVLVTWIAVQITRLLRIQDEASRGKVEAQIRDALHQAALNGLKYAMTRAGLKAGAIPGPTVIAEAIDYVRSKSPDTAAKAGVDDEGLAQIILSKVPDVLGKIAARG